MGEGTKPNAGIFVYSQSGHTVFFARAIADHLREAGIECDIELLRTYKIPTPFSRNIELRRIPDVKEYDILLLGAPVMAFNVSPVILSFINTIDSLKGKMAMPFVTHCLPAKIFGAMRALKKIGSELDILFADVIEGESVHCFFRANKKKMDEAAERIIERIKSKQSNVNP